MTPAGLAALIAFVVFIVAWVVVSMNKNKKFDEEIKTKYPVKDSYGNMYVTEKGELFLYCPAGMYKEYRKWNLSEIGYFATSREKFSICDHDRNAMPGELFTAGQSNAFKEKAIKNFPIGAGNSPQGYAEFLRKHASHIEYI